MNEERVWQIAEEFRNWVCRELQASSPLEREQIRGDYLFYIDEVPRFVVVLEKDQAYSAQIKKTSKDGVIELEWDKPLGEHLFNANTLSALLNGGARAVIMTDGETLLRLLTGTVKAKIAFLSAKVKISGDLVSFLNMVHLVKRRGVRPLQSL